MATTIDRFLLVYLSDCLHAAGIDSESRIATVLYSNGCLSPTLPHHNKHESIAQHQNAPSLSTFIQTWLGCCVVRTHVSQSFPKINRHSLETLPQLDGLDYISR